MPKLVEHSCDWLTVTSADQRVITALGAVWWPVMMAALEDGGIITASKWLGYEGQVVNNQFYGSRPDGNVMRLTGVYAKRFAQPVLKTGAHCTRIDFQVTEQRDEYEPLYGETQRQSAFTNRATLMGRHWPKLKRRDEDGDGDTINTGARASDKFGRLYDKQKESGDDLYVRCWRWEVEYKGPVAIHYAAQLRTADDAIGLARAIVYNQYSEWGFCPPFAGNVTSELFVSSPVESDKAKTINWLSIQVRPSVERLIENDVSRETLLSILGLLV